MRAASEFNYYVYHTFPEFGEYLIDYKDIVFAGWDLNPATLDEATAEHDVLTHKQFIAVEDELARIRPWRAVGDKNFLSNIEGSNVLSSQTHLEIVAEIRRNLSELESSCDSAVVINLASTEKLTDEDDPIFSSLIEFEKALSENSEKVSPAMLYAYAAIAEGVPYGNFTPSIAADIP